MSFRTDFAWGAATAAYQIEGAPEADGKGRSVWDDFVRVPGKVQNADTGDRACEHYQRMDADVGLMAELGLNAYRFSISWPRVFPEGRGRVNSAGLDFYDRLVDRLLARNIAPWATLFHWDFPAKLQELGGWENAESAAWFAEYAAVVAEKLGDRVCHWMTLNEPQVFLRMGHKLGVHAPGLSLAPSQLVKATHNVLLAHGLAVQAIRKNAKPGCRIGWASAGPVSTVDPVYAKDPEVLEHARAGVFGVHNVEDFSGGNSVWCDPVFLGRYPQPYIEAHEKHLPSSWQSDCATISQPIDFCGMNIYSAWGGCHTRDANGKPCWDGKRYSGPGFPRSHFEWAVVPESLYWGPRFFYERYKLPIVITENGLSGNEWVSLDGKVHDPLRIDYAARYLRELKRAAADGVDVGGYFHWSLMDNFEWAEGYRHRFGLVHVDFGTQKRTIKDSGDWYRGVIATNGAGL